MKKTIITFGVFDMFHFGHLKLFLNIKKLCGENNYLTVLVQDSEYILKYKPQSKIFYSTEERVEMIKNLRCVDNVYTYKNVDEDIKNLSFDIWAKGPDQIHEGFQRAIKYCKENNKEVLILPRTEGISSTYLKGIVSDLSENKNGIN